MFKVHVVHGPTSVAMDVVRVDIVAIEWSQQNLVFVWHELTQQDQYQIAWCRLYKRNNLINLLKKYENVCG